MISKDKVKSRLDSISGNIENTLKLNYKMENNVNHPKHYNQLPIECIDVVKHFDFIIGNVIKYCWRAGLKNSDTELEDLKKAKFYIEYKIKMLEDEKS